MTRILTGYNPPDTVGWVFQSIFIIWSVFDIAVFLRYCPRYFKIQNKSSVDKLYFSFLLLSILSETIRAIDPFSMNNIYPFFVNRLFQIFFGTFIATNFGIISGDTYHSILYKINQQIRASYFRYFALTAIFIVSLPALFAIFIITYTEITVNENDIEAANMALRITFSCTIFGLTMILIAFLTDISNMKKPSPPPIPELDADNEAKDEDYSRQEEIIMHAKQRVIKGLRSQMMNIIFSIIGLALELIDGGYAINGYFFLSGIIYGIALRIVPTILLFTQWIPSDDDKAGDDDAAPLTTRQTTVGFLREIGQGIDLKRIKSQNTEIQQLVKDQ